MTNNKKSSVDFLWNQLPEILKFTVDTETALKLLEAFEQAKEMHKNEIIEAFDEGQEYEYQYHINSTPKFDSETYYIETFGGTHE
jgi:hypothetical protein